ncbi:MAG TPA: hypothetical protein DCZ10_19965, partial [Pelotomaculum sp.]|nr:hypothetical protein [Pelotomaculum sp.]
AASLISSNSGQRRYISIYFAYTDETNLSFASVDFDIADESDNLPAASFGKYGSLEADTFEFAGDYEQDLWYEATHFEYPRFFTDFEKDYRNKKVDGISCTVSAASTDSIILKTETTLDAISSYEIYVIDEIYVTDDGELRELEILRGTGKIEKGYSPQDIILAPTPYEARTIMFGPENSEIIKSEWHDPPLLYSGKTYRLDMGLLDVDGNIVYRQREYVTIP